MKQLEQAENFIAKNPWLCFNVILVLAASLRFLYAFELPLMVSDGDAMSRLEMAWEWAQDPYLLPGGLIWLPFHFALIGFPTYLLNVSIWQSSTAVTLLCSLLSFPLLFSISKKRFNTAVALLACLLLAVNPFHIKYSVLSMTEVPFVFFALAAIWCFYMFIEKGVMSYLVASSIFLNCCSLIRFEGWIISALLTFNLLYYGKGIRLVVVYGCLNVLSIAFYILISYTTTGNLIHGLVMSDKEVRFAYAAINDKWMHVINGMKWERVLPLWLLPFLFYGVYIGIKKKIELPYLFTGLFLLFLITWKVLRFETEPAWRYFSVSLIILLPYLSLAILNISNQIALFRLSLIAIISILLLKQSVVQFNDISKSLGDTNGTVIAAEWLSHQRKPNQKVFYHSNDFSFSGFRILSNTPKTDLYYPHYPGMKKFSNYEEFTPVVLTRLVVDSTFSYFVYRQNTTTDSFFQINSIKHLKDSLLKKGKDANDFRVLIRR